MNDPELMTDVGTQLRDEIAELIAFTLFVATFVILHAKARALSVLMASQEHLETLDSLYFWGAVLVIIVCYFKWRKGSIFTRLLQSYMATVHDSMTLDVAVRNLSEATGDVVTRGKVANFRKKLILLRDSLRGDIQTASPTQLGASNAIDFLADAIKKVRSISIRRLDPNKPAGKPGRPKKSYTYSAELSELIDELGGFDEMLKHVDHTVYVEKSISLENFAEKYEESAQKISRWLRGRVKN